MQSNGPRFWSLAGNFAAGMLGFTLLFAIIAFTLETSRPVTDSTAGKDPSAVAAELRAGMFAGGLLGIRPEMSAPRGATSGEDLRKEPFGSSVLTRREAAGGTAEPKSASERDVPGGLRSSLRGVTLLQSASFTDRELLVAGFALAFAAMCAVTLGLSRQFRRVHALPGRTGRRT